MKISVKALAFVLAIATLLPSLPVFAAEIGSTPDAVAEYAYEEGYLYFDFENYKNASSHKEYMAADSATTANGALCDPYGFFLDSTAIGGKGKLVTEENGNKYYSYEKSGGNEDALALLTLTDKAQNDLIIADSAQISLRFRIASGLGAENNLSASSRLPIIALNRGSVSGGELVYADISGNIYALVDGVCTLVFENSTPDDFISLTLKWYDVTNTYSLFVNNQAVVEAIPLNADLRTEVTQTFDDDFHVSSRVQSNSDYTAIELFNTSALSEERWAFDIDDIKVEKLHTAQDRRIYYENSYEAAADGMGLALTGVDTYKYATNHTITKNDGYISFGASSGIRILDNHYQQFTQDSFVTEFKIKGSPSHTSTSLKPLVELLDNLVVNTYYMLYFDKDGNLYLKNDKASIINGFTLNDEEWLDIAIVLTKNMSNKGKFGKLIGKTASSYNTQCVFSYFINGEYVGSSDYTDFSEWKKSVSDYTYRRTASNLMYSSDIKTYTVDGSTVLPLDTSALTVVDSTTTANHIIYKTTNENGCPTYYDVEYDSNNNQIKYAELPLKPDPGRSDYIRIAQYVEGSIDDLRLYEGSLPEFYFESLYSKESSTFFKLVPKHLGNTGTNTKVISGSVGPDLLGIIRPSGFFNSDYNLTTGKSNLFFPNSSYVDVFLPVPADADSFVGEFSFEASLKNITEPTKNNSTWKFSLFIPRFEDTSGSGQSATSLITIGKGTVAGDLTLYGNGGVELYNADGTQAELDNENGSVLRADLYVDHANREYLVSYYKDGEPLYLKDGSLAYRLYASNVDKKFQTYFGTNNTSARLFYPSGTCYADVDYFSIGMRNTEAPLYEKSLSEALTDGVSVFEFNAPAFKAMPDRTEYIDLIKLNKTTSNLLSDSLISVEPSTGRLTVGSNEAHYMLCDAESNPLTLSESAKTPIAVIYDDVRGTARFYVNRCAAYVLDNGTAKPAVDLPIFDPAFTANNAGEKISAELFLGFDGNSAAKLEDLSFNTYSVNKDDTAEVIGLQPSVISTGMRVVAGVDTLYYESVGFEVSVFEGGELKKSETTSSNLVFSSIIENGNIIEATSKGYRYFATLTVDSIPEIVPDDSYAEVRSFTEVAGVKHYGAKQTILVSNDGFEFVQSNTPVTHVMSSISDSIKLHGRAFELGTAISLDHSAAGFEFEFEGEGDVIITTTSSEAVKFAVTVDGATVKNIDIPEGTGSLTVATGLINGKHSVKIISESAVNRLTTVNSVTLIGKLLDAPADTDTYIEFIGDSITAGYGLSATEGGDHHDATLSYAYRTAELLKSDYAIFARSGMGIAYAEGGVNIFENRYKYLSYLRNTEDLYTPERTPDLVVVNLAQNDNNQWKSSGGNLQGSVYNNETFDKKFALMIETITDLYGKDIPMLFVYGCMESNSYVPLATERSKYLIDNVYTATAGYNVKYVNLTPSKDGLSGHPTAEGAEVQSYELAEFIKQNYTEFGDTARFTKKQAVLLMGQSNMVGRGQKEFVEEISDDRILMFNGTEWVKMVEPVRLNRENRENETSLAASFAKAFVETFDCEIGLIPTAVGGSSLSQWTKGSTAGYYEAALELARAAMEDSEICAILWHQGESDRTSATYAERVKVIFDDMIEDLGLDRDKIVIITGELGAWEGKVVEAVNTALKDIDEEGYYAKYGVASQEGLTNIERNGSDSHFDSPSLRVFGYRYFESFYEELTGRECTYPYSQDPDFYRIDSDNEEEIEDTSGYLAYESFNTLTPASYSETVTVKDGLIFNALESNTVSIVKQGKDIYATLIYNQSGAPNVTIATPCTNSAPITISLDILVGEYLELNGIGDLITVVDANGTQIPLIGLGMVAGETAELNEYFIYDSATNNVIAAIPDFHEWANITISCDFSAKTMTVSVDGEKSTVNVTDEDFSDFVTEKVIIADLAAAADGIISVDNFKLAAKAEAEAETIVEIDFEDYADAVYKHNGTADKASDKTSPTTGKALAIPFAYASGAYVDVYGTSPKGTTLSVELSLMLSEDFEINGVPSLVKITPASGSSINILALTTATVNGEKKFFLYDPTPKTVIGSAIELGVWNDIKIVCDMTNDVKTIYVNGEKIYEKAVSSSSVSAATFATAKIRLAQCEAKAKGTVYIDNFKHCNYDSLGVATVVNAIDFDNYETKTITTKTSNTATDPIYYFPSATGPISIVERADTIKMNASSTTPISIEGNSYLSFDFNGSSGNHYLDIYQSVAAGTSIIIEADFMFSSEFTTGTASMIKIAPSSGSTINSLGLKQTTVDGKNLLYFYDPISKTTITSYVIPRDRWINVKLVCDMANDKKDLYVDGVLILEDATISSSSISSATHKVGKIRMFQLSTTSSGAVYLDNYKFSSFDTSGNESLLLSIDFEDETVYPNNKVYTSNTANTTACPIYFYGSSTQTYTLHRLGKHMEITYDGKNSPYADIINATEAGKNISVEFELSFGPEVLCCELGDLIQLVDSNKNETTLLKLKSDSIEDGIINYLCDPANNASVGSAFSAGDKVSVKIICDFKNQTKDIYLNDTLVVSDTALENASESFAAVATRIGDLGSSATGTLHINNYKLSYVS